ncbi:hypothetical protein JTB14_028339 [Gonioctena quinquepunctata]|nr:hypothetical protein JTB14_028339 [Gonioctena quinquepunctata]
MKNVEKVEKVVSVKTNETQTNSGEVSHQFTMTEPALPSGILMGESNREQDEEGNHYQNREMTLLKKAIHISEGKYVKATRKLVKTGEKKKNAKNTVIRNSDSKKCDKQQKKAYNESCPLMPNTAMRPNTKWYTDELKQEKMIWTMLSICIGNLAAPVWKGFIK